jgi:hypothetical protein
MNAEISAYAARISDPAPSSDFVKQKHDDDWYLKKSTVRQ